MLISGYQVLVLCFSLSYLISDDLLDCWLVGAGKRIDKIPSVITDALVASSDGIREHL